ncbi:MAG: sigma-70 family RNA polymerase sigma factor [Acidobacteriota bacterium]
MLPFERHQCEGATESHQRGDVTELLKEWREGSEEALQRLIPLVYGELRSRAARYLRHERAGHTLQPTALVHEAFLRLFGQHPVEWQNRAQFFGVAAQMMRRILVDHARSKYAGKRGGVCIKLDVESVEDAPAGATTVDVVAVDQALSRLAALDPDQARVVELRFFGGLTVEETAEVIGCSPRTVKREWRSAKAWLHRELSGAGAR